MGNVNAAWRAIQIAAATIGGVLSALFGELDVFLKALLVFIVLDYLTGIVVAIVRKQLSSEVGFKGIAKKVMILVLVMVGQIVDTVIGIETFRTMVILFYITNEGVSILENAVNLGLPVPAKLKAILQQISSDGDKSEDKHDENSL